MCVSVFANELKGETNETCIKQKAQFKAMQDEPIRFRLSISLQNVSFGNIDSSEADELREKEKENDR